MGQKPQPQEAVKGDIPPFFAKKLAVLPKAKVKDRHRPKHGVVGKRPRKIQPRRRQKGAGHAAAGTIDARQQLKGAAHLKDEHQRDPNDQPCGDQQLFLPPDAAHGDSPLPVNIVADGARDMLACGII